MSMFFRLLSTKQPVFVLTTLLYYAITDPSHPASTLANPSAGFI